MLKIARPIASLSGFSVEWAATLRATSIVRICARPDRYTQRIIAKDLAPAQMGRSIRQRTDLTPAADHVRRRLIEAIRP